MCSVSLFLRSSLFFCSHVLVSPALDIALGFFALVLRYVRCLDLVVSSLSFLPSVRRAALSVSSACFLTYGLLSAIFLSSGDSSSLSLCCLPCVFCEVCPSLAFSHCFDLPPCPFLCVFFFVICPKIRRDVSGICFGMEAALLCVVIFRYDRISVIPAAGPQKYGRIPPLRFIGSLASRFAWMCLVSAFAVRYSLLQFRIPNCHPPVCFFLVYPISPSGFLHWFPFLFFACVVFRVVCLRCFLSLFRYVFLVPLLYFLLGCRFAVSLAMRYFERLGISSIRRRLGPVASGGIGRAPIFYFSL